MPYEQRRYSVLGRMLWQPLFSAPFTYTAPRILLPAALIGILASVIAGIDAGLKVAAIDWIFACCLVSFTYGRGHGAETRAADRVPVHILSPFGYQTARWMLGSDITLDQYVRHRDASTGELFVLTVFRDGRETMHLLDRAHWLEAKRQMETNR
jgi:hypothetical protein